MNKRTDRSQSFHFNRSTRILGVASLVAASFAMLGCMEAPESEDIGEAQQASKTDNGLSYNGLSYNALTTNALTTNALTTNALTTNALTTNALVSGALNDPLAREFLKYAVSCALREGDHVDFTIDGVAYSFPGHHGLAPEWREPGGSCGPSCRKWVSACVLSRVNYLGVPTPISIRGDHAALETTEKERDDFSRGEAAYWGDVFASPQVRKACLYPGQTEIPRVCGPTIVGCVAEVVGDCEDVCDGALNDGAYVGCDDADANGENAPVTVFNM
jgi:hypothetical protein